jgi:hypothetical protein
VESYFHTFNKKMIIEQMILVDLWLTFYKKLIDYFHNDTCK